MGVVSSIGRVVPNSLQYLVESYRETGPIRRRLAVGGGLANALYGNVSLEMGGMELARTVLVEFLLFFADMNRTLLGFVDRLADSPTWLDYLVVTVGAYSVLFATRFLLSYLTGMWRTLQNISREVPSWDTYLFVAVPTFLLLVFVGHILSGLHADGVFRMEDLVWPWEGYVVFVLHIPEFYILPALEYVLGLPVVGEYLSPLQPVAEVIRSWG